MTKEQIEKINVIEKTIKHFKVIPYNIVKKDLDIAARKTRKALGITLRKTK
jgi:hypothetical protein